MKLNLNLVMFCTTRGWSCDSYARGRWFYIRIRSSDTAPFPTHKDWVSELTRYVTWYYASASLVRHSASAIVFNVGTVFDRITEQSRPGITDTLANMTPKEFAESIIKVQPMSSDAAGVFSPAKNLTKSLNN